MNEKTETAWEREPQVSEVYPELLHYTSIGALEGILESNTLWATHAHFLNDSSEMKLMWGKTVPYVRKYLISTALADPDRYRDRQDVIESYGSVEGAADHDARKLIEIMRSLLLGDDATPGFYMPFMTCFTTHKKSYDRRNGLLSQWRGYGDDGVMIVFRTRQLENLLEREFAPFCCLSSSIAKVVYDKPGLDLEAEFPKFFGVLDLVSGAIVDGLSDNQKSLEALDELLKELFLAVGRLKHWGFREEKECRIIAGLPEKGQYDRIVASGTDDREFKEIRHRLGRCNAIPYVRLFEDTAKLPISEVLVGPSRNQLANVEVVEQLLRHLAPGRGIVLKKSEIPFVGTA